MVYEDIYDAKNACDHLSGFNVANRYLIVLYYNPQRTTKKVRHRQVVRRVIFLVEFTAKHAKHAAKWL